MSHSMYCNLSIWASEPALITLFLYSCECVLVAQSCLTVAHQVPLSMEPYRQEYWNGLPGDLPDPGIEPRSPTLQVDSLPSESPGKPKNTGVTGSLSLLWRKFPTQDLNQGLLHCRQILYQLIYQGSPISAVTQRVDFGALWVAISVCCNRRSIELMGRPCYSLCHCIAV